jgi:cytochrome c peroxidase
VGRQNNAYDNWGQYISKHERSPRISAFSAKFDAFLAGSYPPTADEMTGYNVFKGKG